LWLLLVVAEATDRRRRVSFAIFIVICNWCGISTLYFTWKDTLQNNLDLEGLKSLKKKSVVAINEGKFQVSLKQNPMSLWVVLFIVFPSGAARTYFKRDLGRVRDARC
jgi:hypothetical protein